MILEPEKTRLVREKGKLRVVVDGEAHPVDRVARAFPKSNPGHYVGLMDPEGREIGMIEEPDRLDDASQELLREELKAVYFVPTIQEIVRVTARGSGSVWEVMTDDGEREFRIQDRDALDGSDPPAIMVTDLDGKRYKIEDYWALDRESQAQIRDLLPDKVLRARIGRTRTRGRVMRFR